MKRHEFIEKIKDLSRRFQQNLIFVGGTAVYLYSLKYGVKPETPRDVDLITDEDEYYNLKNVFCNWIYENPRLKKMIIDRSLKYEVYLGVLNDDILNNSIIYEDIKLPSLEHLLISKNYIYSERKGTTKSEKDIRDLVKIMFMLNKKGINYDIFNRLDYSKKRELFENLNEIKGYLKTKLKNMENDFKSVLRELVGNEGKN